MALPLSNIESGEWNLYDRKHIRVSIPGADLRNVGLRFALLDRPGGEVLLEKEGEEAITLVTQALPDVLIGGTTDEELIADYSNLHIGVFYWELYDTDTPLKIANGYATIGHGAPPSA